LLSVYTVLQTFTKVFTVILQFRSFTEVLQKYLQIFTIGRDWYKAKDQLWSVTSDSGKEIRIPRTAGIAGECASSVSHDLNILFP
jgi:glycerol-3-phosphate cytidylyltransferase-like family protein